MYGKLYVVLVGARSSQRRTYSAKERSNELHASDLLGRWRLLVGGTLRGGTEDGDGQDGRTLTTDGPFPETKEALGGYYLLEADDLDTAIELAARIPAARMGGAIEVRPLVER